jgi:hypothetical protein
LKAWNLFVEASKCGLVDVTEQKKGRSCGEVFHPLSLSRLERAAFGPSTGSVCIIGALLLDIAHGSLRYIQDLA